MSWKNRIRKGSFRGVPFLIESADGELGRRVVLHEYPQRDKPYSEDMGRKTRKFSLDLFVLGPDYMTARDKLIKAFETEGSGTLVHPYLGNISVVAEDVRGPRESTREGGMARFSVTFVESGEKVQPTEEVNTASAVSSAANAALETVSEDFQEDFSVDDQPSWVADAAVSTGKKFFSALKSMKDKLSAISDTLTEYESAIHDAVDDVASLIRAPGQFATTIMGLVNDLKSLPNQISSAFAMYGQLFDLFGDDFGDVPRSDLTDSGTLAEGSTESRIQQKANQTAIVDFVKKAALIEAARTASEMNFTNGTEAQAVIEQLTGWFDEAMEMETTTDASYAAMVQLKATVIRDINLRGRNLKQITHYTPATTLPALVIAHLVYGDARREADIVSRNAIVHPGFVSGGVELEIIQ